MPEKIESYTHIKGKLNEIIRAIIPIRKTYYSENHIFHIKKAGQRIMVLAFHAEDKPKEHATKLEKLLRTGFDPERIRDLGVKPIVVYYIHLDEGKYSKYKGGIISNKKESKQLQGMIEDCLSQMKGSKFEASLYKKRDIIHRFLSGFL